MGAIKHTFMQGSAQWHAHRATHFNASEAAAMLGISEYQTRSQLIAEKALGSRAEPTATEQALFYKGHSNEAAARPIGESIIGEDLFPVIASLEVDGLPLSASYDGSTMADDVTWEHKSLNKALEASLSAGIIPDQYKPQMEQQLLILGAQRCLFMASNGDPETALHAWYESDPVLRAQIIAGWKLLKEEIDNYKHVEVLPPAVGKSLMALPTLSIALSGEITSSNLAEYKATASSFIASINTDLETDEDFATAEKTVTFFDAAEKELEAVKSRALAQTASIDELFRTMDTLREEMRTKRLYLDRLVTTRKETIKAQVRQSGIDRLAEHVASLNKRLGRDCMPAVPADFAGVMKSKRTITSLRNAVDTELARAKLAGNATADTIQLNLNLLAARSDMEFLFADANTIVLKAPDDCAALIKLRITEHEEKERRRVEAERERIRKEEADKLARAELTQTVGHSPAFPFPLPVAPSVTPQQASQVSAVAPVALPATRKESDLLFWVHSIVSDTRIPDDIARTQILNATRPLFAARAA